VRYAAQSVATVPYEAEDTLDSGGGYRAALYLDSACMPLMYWSTNSFQR
jgi:hypothetical protein